MSAIYIVICSHTGSNLKNAFPIYFRALVAFVSYFVIGAIILRVKYQKSGSDLIINKEFWKDFPILIKVRSTQYSYLCMCIANH